GWRRSMRRRGLTPHLGVLAARRGDGRLLSAGMIVSIFPTPVGSTRGTGKNAECELAPLRMPSTHPHFGAIGVDIVSPGASVLIAKALLAPRRFSYDGRKARLMMSY